MSIIRVRKEEKYSVIANSVLQDSNLSWEARGVMAYLLSKPDGWQCRNYDLINQGPAGKHIIRRVLKELQEAGYIRRYQKSDGHKIEWITEIYESPELNTTSRNTEFLPAEEPTGGNSASRESGHIVSTDSNNNGQLVNKDINRENFSKTEKDDLNTLADTVADTCNLDIDTASAPTRKAIKDITLRLYNKKVTATDLNEFKDWWYTNDWRGKKNQPPTPAQVGDTWGQFEATRKEVQMNSSYTPKLTSEQLAALRYFQEEADKKIETK